MKCPHCGAEFKVPSEVKIATCPYCGTTLNIETNEIETEHYIFPVIYDDNRAYGKLKAIISRQFGVPSDLTENSNLKNRQLHYIPLYIYYVEGRALVKSGEAIEVDTVAIPALRIIPLPIPSNYKFPVRGRVYFKPSIIKMGKYYSPQLTHDKLENIVKMKIYYRLLGEVKLTHSNSPIDIECKYEGLVHYPIWDFTYEYRRRNYRGIVDAVCGEVLYAEYPMSTIHRTLLFTIAAGLIGSGFAIGMVIGLILKSTLTGIIGGVIAGISGAIPSFMKTAFKKQIYRPKFYSKFSRGEIEKALEKSFDLIKFIPKIEL